MAVVEGPILIDNQLLGSNVYLYSRAHLIYSYSTTETGYTITYDGRFYMSSNPAGYASAGYRVGFSAMLTCTGQSGYRDINGSVRWEDISSGTTPQEIVNNPAKLIGSYAGSRTHQAQSITLSLRVQTGWYVGESDWSIATATISIPARRSFTVSYNAGATSGVSGLPSNQTKWYGENLTLSSTKPTRTGGYVFQGWATTSGGNVAYSPGSTYTNNAAVTLYAKWKADDPPTITNVKCDRCTSNGTLDDEGTYARITADYTAITTGNSANKVATAVTTLGNSTQTTNIGAKTGSFTLILGTFSAANIYRGTVVFTDSNGRTTSVGLVLMPASWPIDAAFKTGTYNGTAYNAYAVGLLGPAVFGGDSEPNRLTVYSNVNSHGEWIYFGDHTNAGLYAHTTGRDGRVLLVRGANADGASIQLGAGGMTLVGGGEAAQHLYEQYITDGSMGDGDEHLMLGADGSVYIFAHCQYDSTTGTMPDLKQLQFSSNGNLIAPGPVYFGNNDGNYRAHFTATDQNVYLISDNTSDGKRMQIAVNTSTGNILQQVYDGSAWGSWYNIGGSNHLTFSANAKINVGADAVIYINGLAYRMVFTSGGNIRVDTSSDSGASWTAGGGGYTPRGGSTASTLSHAANTVWAAPSGSAGMANFRKLVQADLPIHNTSNIKPDASKTTYGGLTRGATKYTSADIGNWNYMAYSDGTVHAWGVVMWNGSTQTALGNWYYNSTDIYIQLPFGARTIQSVIFGACLGGSGAFGSIAAPSGAAGDWSYATSTATKYNIPFRVMSPASRGNGTYYFPVDVWFMKA